MELIYPLDGVVPKFENNVSISMFLTTQNYCNLIASRCIKVTAMLLSWPHLWVEDQKIFRGWRMVQNIFETADVCVDLMDHLLKWQNDVNLSTLDNP